MKFLKNYFEKAKPTFTGDGKLSKYFPLYDVLEHFFFTTVRNTKGQTAIRDAVDVQRIMVMVWVCTFPAMFYGMHNLGFQALSVIEQGVGTLPADWQGALVAILGIHDSSNILHTLMYGAIFFVPIYIVTFVAGIIWEGIFAVVRKEEINEGFFVTSVLFALSCPPDVPLWQVALGISFGVVVAKEIFGGTGMNFINPALAGRAFLYFAYPASWSGDSSWIAADGVSQATPLGIAAGSGISGVLEQWSFFDVALGNIPGSIGEGSMLMIALGGAVLLITKVASWRIVLGVVLGVFVASTIFNLVGSESNPMFGVPFYWHFALGGLAFMMFFMATEPVTASGTPTGRWIYGFLIGFICVLIRVVNPAFPEGAMLAVLMCNLAAPTIDYYVIKAQLSRSSNQAIGLK